MHVVMLFWNNFWAEKNLFWLMLEMLFHLYASNVIMTIGFLPFEKSKPACSVWARHLASCVYSMRSTERTQFPEYYHRVQILCPK